MGKRDDLSFQDRYQSLEQMLQNVRTTYEEK